MIRKKYTAEFKTDVLVHLKHGGKTVGELKKELGVPANLIRKWRMRYKITENLREPTQFGPNDLTALKKEGYSLKPERLGVEKDREIIKKVLSIFLTKSETNSRLSPTMKTFSL